MDRPSPRVGFGLRGRTQMIWWFRIDELRFAVTVETQVDQSWWLVWHHRQGNWLYRVFEVQPFDASGEWEALYGDIQGIARVEDDFPLFLVLERIERPEQLVWIFCVGVAGNEGEEIYGVLWEMRTPVTPNWTTTRPL
jgi:hypothetical protein